DPLLRRIALSPDGKKLAVAMWNSSIRLWDLDRRKEIFRLERSREASQVCFSPDGRTLGACLAGDNAFHVWDVRTVKELWRTAKTEQAMLQWINFTADGKNLVTVHFAAVGGAAPMKRPDRQFEIAFQLRSIGTKGELRPLGETMVETRTKAEGFPPAAF